MTPTELDKILNGIRDAVHAEVAPLEKTVVALEKRLSNVENGIASLDHRVETLDHRVAALDTRLVNVENQGRELKLELMRRLDEIYDAIQDVMGDLGEQGDRKVAKLRAELELRLRKLEQLQS